MSRRNGMSVAAAQLRNALGSLKAASHRAGAENSRALPQLIIFDLDDTLVDYSAARRLAQVEIESILLRRAPSIDFAAFWSSFREIDRALFREFAAGVLSRENYRQTRFLESLSQFGVADKNLASDLNEAYLRLGNHSRIVYPQTHALLAKFRASGAHLALLTNGPSDGRRAKLQANDLADRFDAVFISEETGIAKPNPQAFRQCLRQFDVEASHALSVGDSLCDDLAPAMELGMRAILIGDEASAAPNVRRVKSLKELLREEIWKDL